MVFQIAESFMEGFYQYLLLVAIRSLYNDTLFSLPDIPYSSCLLVIMSRIHIHVQIICQKFWIYSRQYEKSEIDSDEKNARPL